MSIFDLKTSVEELSSANQGTSRMTYEQLPPSRDVTGNNFPNGAIHFRWEQGGTKWWVPSRSYMRLRCSLTKADGSPLDASDGIAPTMGLCSSLFQSAEFRINDKTVSRIGDFMPQIDAVQTRLTKSKSWLDGIGESVNWWSDDFGIRQAGVTSGVKNVEGEVQRIPRSASSMPDTATVAIEADTGVLTFAAAGGAAVDLSDFEAGDVIEIQSGNDLLKYNVASIAGDTLQLNGSKQLAVAAAALDYSIVKQKEGRNVGEFELIWRPPLSIFQVGHGLPLGKYELVLNPQTNSAYQLYAIESLTAKSPNLKSVGTPTPNSDFKFSIVDMYLYCNTLEGPRVDNMTYLLDLESTNCQSEKIDSTSFQQKNFDVSPSTHALTVCYGDLRAGNDSRASSTKFRVYGDLQDKEPQELNLTRFFCQYAGQSLPQIDADPDYVPGSRDFTTQRYAESQLYSGAYFDSGGAEKIEEFHSRGQYIYQSWPKDATDQSTRVNVHQQFKNGTNVDNMRVFLFSHSKQVARVQITSGRIQSVELEDA